VIRKNRKKENTYKRFAATRSEFVNQRIIASTVRMRQMKTVFSKKRIRKKKGLRKRKVTRQQ
jgi:hypothetical protein